MKKFRLAKDRIFIYTISLYFAGLVFGIFLIRGVSLPHSSNRNFLEVFAANYWYIFLIWLMGFSLIGLIFSSLIIFFRGFLFGALLAVLFPDAFRQLVFLLLLEIVLFLPAFLLVSYFSLALSLRSFMNLFSYQNLNLKVYFNIMIIATIIIVIYSIIIIVYQV
ncbi:MAG TPA: hypothetical protein GX692_07810 [Acholeplasmataceae bacterium]|nr:hypothetical protein [Acholeplasmataceae bacterium]